MKIILDNLSPEQLERVLEFNNMEMLELETKSMQLSHFPNDTLFEPQNGVGWLIEAYLAGEKKYSTVNYISDFSGSNLSFIQQLDLSYRTNKKDLSEFLKLENRSKFIEFRRAYVIALVEGMQHIVDLFVEAHPSDWFSPIKQCRPDLLPNMFGGKLPVSVSKDGSAKKIGDNFYIHAGTNDWNRAWLKSQFWDEQWDKQLNIWQNQLKKTELQFKELKLTDYSLLVVPEKDAISRVTNFDYNNSNHLPFLFIQKVGEKLTNNKLIYPLVELVRLNDDTRLTLPDSHLSASDYWTIFLTIIDKWGFSKEAKELKCEFDFIANYGDLGTKFEKFDGQRQTLEIIEPEIATPVVVAGSEEFKTPLRDCFVKWNNPAPLIDKKVLLLGDSHCSIGASPFLSYLFSRVFSEVSFYWNPYFLNGVTIDLEQEYDFALSEISQRFINPTLK